MAGMRQDVDEYLSSFPAVRQSYQDLCRSDRTRIHGNVQRCLHFYETFMPMKLGPEYQKVLQTLKQNRWTVEKIMQEQQLDALLMPISTTGSATYNPYAINVLLSPVASNAGLPAITINLGYSKPNNMPIGAELIGRQFSEGTLIEMAYAYEQNSPPPISPKLPQPNLSLETLDIPAYNNLITRIAYTTYMKILKPCQSLEFQRL
jgi:amidase